MTEPVYKLEKPGFDGPLGLLLRLIEKNKVDIYDIPVAEITRQYLEQMELLEETDMDVMSDFLVMAATLLQIKARMLLKSDEESGGEEEDPRAGLVERLLEYKRCRHIAAGLKENEISAERSLYRHAPLPAELAEYVPPVDLDSLLSGITAERLKQVYSVLNGRVKSRTNEGASSLKTIKRDRASIVRCLNALKSFTAGHRSFTFRQLVGEKTAVSDVVVSFLAVLELMKLGRLEAGQEGPGADIKVSVKKDASLDDIDFSSLLEE